MTDYEQEYQHNPAACGPPFAEFVEFFERYDRSAVRVLDLGCGQGRDALMIAAFGHSVHGIDISPTGIAQMIASARERGLAVAGEVADLRTFHTDQLYDIVVLDRVVHMLADSAEKESILKTAAGAVNKGGFVLIADTPANLPLIDGFFEERGWFFNFRKKGFRFIKRVHDRSA